MAYIIGKGTLLQYDNGSDYVTITQVTSVTPPALEMGSVETTNLSSTARENKDFTGKVRVRETLAYDFPDAEVLLPGYRVPTLDHALPRAKTIDRIVDVFPAAEKDMVRAMMSESLRAVISQTLLKTKDGTGRVAAHGVSMHPLPKEFVAVACVETLATAARGEDPQLALPLGVLVRPGARVAAVVLALGRVGLGQLPGGLLVDAGVQVADGDPHRLESPVEVERVGLRDAAQDVGREPTQANVGAQHTPIRAETGAEIPALFNIIGGGG